MSGGACLNGADFYQFPTQATIRFRNGTVGSLLRFLPPFAPVKTSPVSAPAIRAPSPRRMLGSGPRTGTRVFFRGAGLLVSPLGSFSHVDKNFHLRNALRMRHSSLCLVIDQGCQTQFPGGHSVYRFLWFPFNQLSIKACLHTKVCPFFSQSIT